MYSKRLFCIAVGLKVEMLVTIVVKAELCQSKSHNLFMVLDYWC